MPEPPADVLIDQLRRANRRWKALALGALAAFVLAVGGLATVAAEQVGREKGAAEAARGEAEEAKRQAEQAEQETREALVKAAQARRRAEQLLYVSRLQLAQKAWEEGEREGKKR